MTIFEELEKKWSSSSISFDYKGKLPPFADIFCLFSIKIDNGVIIIYEKYVEIYLDGSLGESYGAFFDIEYNFYVIDAIIELVLKGVNIETNEFEELVLVKSRENKINRILNN